MVNFSIAELCIPEAYSASPADYGIDGFCRRLAGHDEAVCFLTKSTGLVTIKWRVIMQGTSAERRMEIRNCQGWPAILYRSVEPVPEAGNRVVSEWDVTAWPPRGAKKAGDDQNEWL